MHYECIRMHIYIIYLTQTLICIRTHHTFVINWYTHLFVFLPLAASGSLFRFSVRLHPIGCCYVGQYWLAATEWQVPPTFRLPVTAFPADSCRFFAEPPLCTSISYLIVMLSYHYVITSIITSIITMSEISKPSDSQGRKKKRRKTGQRQRECDVMNDDDHNIA